MSNEVIIPSYSTIVSTHYPWVFAVGIYNPVDLRNLIETLSSAEFKAHSRDYTYYANNGMGWDYLVDRWISGESNR